MNARLAGPSRHLFMPVVLAAWLLALAAQADSPQLKVPFERYRLSNGLTVLLHEDHRTPKVVVNLTFRVGSKDEDPGRTGFAHLFEHLMFMGTPGVPTGRFDELMEQAGGGNNASTNSDETSYVDQGPSHLLELFLWLEADRLATLPEAMTLEKLNLQREVVRNERRQSIENRPYGQVQLVLPEKLYPKGHPYHHPIIGSHQDLLAAKVDDVKTFFRTHYTASNAVLAVAGDFRPAEAKALIEKHLGKLPRLPTPSHRVPPPAALKRSERVVLEDDVQLVRTQLVWHSPAYFAPQDAEADLLADLLGGGKSSRLYDALVRRERLADSVSARQESGPFGSQFVVMANGLPGVTAEALEAALNKELSRLTQEPPTPDELERARAKLETQTLQGLSSLEGLADQLARFETQFGDPGQLERLLARYQHLGPTDIAWFASELLASPSLTVTVVPRPSPKAKGKPRAR